MRMAPVPAAIPPLLITPEKPVAGREVLYQHRNYYGIYRVVNHPLSATDHADLTADEQREVEAPGVARQRELPAAALLEVIEPRLGQAALVAQPADRLEALEPVLRRLRARRLIDLRRLLLGDLDRLVDPLLRLDALPQNGRCAARRALLLQPLLDLRQRRDEAVEALGA